MNRLLIAFLLLCGSAQAQFVPDWLIHPTSVCASDEFVQYPTEGAEATCVQVDYADLSGTPPAASVAIGSTITSGTAGRVLFVGAGPVLAQDTGFNYDPTGNVLSVPFGHFGEGTYNANSTLPGPTTDYPHVWELTNNASGGDAAPGIEMIRMNSYGAAARANNIQFYRFRGTEASPTAIQSGDVIGTIQGRGWDGSFVSQTAAHLSMRATQNWTTSANGAAFYFETQANGTVYPRTQRVQIGPGASPALTVTGDLSTSGNYSGGLSGGTGLPLTTGVTGTLPVANGGTNLTGATDDNVMVGNGTTWQSKAVADCDDSAGNHLNYDTATNAFSCGTSGGAGTVTSVNITAPAAGITASGGPVTASGSITLALADDLSAVEGLSSNGLAARTASNTWTTRTITAGSGISISNGDGVSGNPTISATAGGTTFEWDHNFVKLPVTSYGATNADCVYGGVNSGAISSVASEAGAVGIAQITTASSSNAVSRIGCHNGATPTANSGVAGLVIPGGSVSIATCLRYNLSALPTAAQDISFAFGLQDLTNTGGGANNVATLGMNWNASNNGSLPQWRTVMKANNGSTVIRNNISTVASAGAWHTICATWNSAGTQIDFSVDGSSVQVETANLPTIALAPVVIFDKTAGTTTVTVKIDRIWVHTF